MAAVRRPNLSRALRNLTCGNSSPSRNPAIYNVLSKPSTRSITTTSSLCTSSSNTNDASSKPYTSIDPSEVSHFTSLASSWWDPHGSSRLLHLMNPLRHRFIQSCLFASNTSPPPHSLTYLDIGCGGGIFAESAARLTSTTSVLALDPTPECIKVAEAHKKRDPGLCIDGKLTYLNKSIEQLERSETAQSGKSRAQTQEKQQFDIVTVFEVIEHISTPADFLQQVMPHVKPGGWLVMSTIARTWVSWVTTKLMAEDVLGIVPRGTHEWGKYVNEEELRGWFAKQEGWSETKSLGCMYVPGIGWREVQGGEKLGNYFFGVRRKL